MSRAAVWLQLLVGWLPIWALFTTLIVVAHEGTTTMGAALIALRMIVAAAVLGVAVHRLIARLPWPHPFRLSFVGVHLLAAVAFTVSWFALNSAIESLFRGAIAIVIGPGIGAYLITGVWLYVMIAGVAYAIRAAERAAQAEALAVGTQLAALRAQLHPHFLFNALHTVVQLIPADPRGAARAAELLAGVLRTTLEEQRDRITLAEEWRFVQRYLEIEGIRFGDRLVVREEIAPAARAALLPSFAVQTLVENAVRHGAAPRVEPTGLRIAAAIEAGMLRVTVADNGAGASAERVAQGPGSGLRRLRERLGWLYGSAARLETASNAGGGFIATLVVPQNAAPAASPDRPIGPHDRG